MKRLMNLFLVLCICSVALSCGAENSDDIVEHKVLPPHSAGPEWYSNMANMKDDYIYGVGEAASASSSVSRERAATSAKVNLSRAASESVKARIQETMAIAGDFDKGNEEIVSAYTKAAISYSNNVIKAPEPHKEQIYRYKSGFKSFVAYKIKREELNKKVYEAIEKKAHSEADPSLKKKLLESLKEINK